MLREIAEHAVEKLTSSLGLCLPGDATEYSELSDEEKEAVIAEVCDIAQGGMGRANRTSPFAKGKSACHSEQGGAMFLMQVVMRKSQRVLLPQRVVVRPLCIEVC